MRSDEVWEEGFQEAEPDSIRLFKEVFFSKVLGLYGVNYEAERDLCDVDIDHRGRNARGG